MIKTLFRRASRRGQPVALISLDVFSPSGRRAVWFWAPWVM